MRYIFLSILLIASSIFANTINVPDDFETIQAGIDASEDGDTVLVQPGRYVENIDFNGHNIVVGSLYLTTGDTSYVERTVIDGNGANTVVQIASGEDDQTEIVGFTVSGGGEQWLGGGLFIRNANPRLNRLIIQDNAVGTGHGGGIYVDRDSHLAIDSCIFMNNQAGYGAGIYAKDGCVVTISNSLFTENHANSAGAGVYCISRGTIVELTDVVIQGNSTTSAGGTAITAVAYSTVIGNRVHACNNSTERGEGGAVLGNNYAPILIFYDSEFTNNTASGNGGAFCISYRAELTLERSIIANNVTSGYAGGGIYAWEDCSVNIVTTTIIGNRSRDVGGSLYMGRRIRCQIDRSTIAENHTDENDNSVYLKDASVLAINNSILRRNAGSEITAPRTGDVNQVSLSYSDLANGIDGIDDNHNIDITWGDSNIDADPLFADSENGDYHLTEDSPCIDAGDPNSHPDPDGTRADMGAFYFEQDVPRPVIYIEPDGLNFGIIGVGDEAFDTLTVFNFGGEPLLVEEISIREQEAFLIESGGEPFELQPGENHTIVVRFLAFEVMDYVDILSINCNDPAREIVEIPLTCSAILMIPHLAIDPAELDFGYVAEGDYAERCIVLSNTGNRLLNILSLAIDPWQSPFCIVQGGEVLTIEPDSIRTVTIRFSPTSIESYDAFFLIESDDPDREFIEVDLLGSARSIRDGLGTPPSKLCILSMTPNPFNAVTRLTYGLPSAGKINLSIYDIAGREIATLFSGEQAAGIYSVSWNAEGVPTGVYFCWLTTPTQSFSQKVVLVR